jgi:uncharacterized protein YgbK (DUF1537 family)
MITVVADDLTGAAEIAGICLRYGMDVAFGIDAIPEKSAQVTIIATDSRSLTEEEAYETHLQLAGDIIKKNPNQIIFKKCDSVLRGHVLTEISAMINITSKKSVLLQPSNPLGKRCISDGIYYVNDVKIENTGFASDPDFPVKTSSVKSLLLDRSSKKDTIQVFTGMIHEINPKGFYIPDCSHESDLMNNLKLYTKDMIIGGSGAFFEQFLIKLKVVSAKKDPEKLNFSKDYLLVSGSTHPKSIAFTKSLENKNCPILLFPETLLQKDMEESHLIHWIEEVSKIYNENKKAALRISNEIIEFTNSSRVLKIRMSFVVKYLFERCKIDEIFIEGGATAYDLFDKLNWHSFTPVAELASGVVRMHYDHDPKKHITIKPGSYEWPDGLLN